MIDRDNMTSTYMGNDVAIPGPEEAKKTVLRSGFTEIQVPKGVDFDGQKVRLIFGIAGKDGNPFRNFIWYRDYMFRYDNIKNS